LTLRNLLEGRIATIHMGASITTCHEDNDNYNILRNEGRERGTIAEDERVLVRVALAHGADDAIDVALPRVTLHIHLQSRR